MNKLSSLNKKRLALIIFLMIIIELIPINTLATISINIGTENYVTIVDYINKPPENLIILGLNNNWKNQTQQYYKMIFFLNDNNSELHEIYGAKNENYRWSIAVPFKDNTVALLKSIKENNTCILYYALFDAENRTILTARKYYAGPLLCKNNIEPGDYAPGPNHSIILLFKGKSIISNLYSWNTSSFSPPIYSLIQENENSLITLLTINESHAITRSYHLGNTINYWSPPQLLVQNQTILLKARVSPHYAMFKDIYTHNRTIYNMTAGRLENTTNIYDFKMKNTGILIATIEPETLELTHTKFYQASNNTTLEGVIAANTNKSILLFRPVPLESSVQVQYEQEYLTLYTINSSIPEWVKTITVNKTELLEALIQLDITDQNSTIDKALFQIPKSKIVPLNTGNQKTIIITPISIFVNRNDSTSIQIFPILQLYNETGELEWTTIIPLQLKNLQTNIYDFTIIDAKRILITLATMHGLLTIIYDLENNTIILPQNKQEASTTISSNYYEALQATYGTEHHIYGDHMLILKNGNLYSNNYYNTPWKLEVSYLSMDYYATLYNTIVNLSYYNILDVENYTNLPPKQYTEYKVLEVTPEGLHPDPFTATNITANPRIAEQYYVECQRTNATINVAPRYAVPPLIMAGYNISTYLYNRSLGEEPVNLNLSTLLTTGYTIIIRGIKNPGYEIDYNKVPNPITKVTSGNITSLPLNVKISVYLSTESADFFTAVQILPTNNEYSQETLDYYFSKTYQGNLQFYPFPYLEVNSSYLPSEAGGHPIMIWSKHSNYKIKINVITDNQPTITNQTISIPLKYPLASFKTDMPETLLDIGILEVARNPTYMTLTLTNIGTETGIFIYAIFMPFYMNITEIIVPNDNETRAFKLSEAYSVRDADLVMLLKTILAPGESKTLLVKFKIDSKTVYREESGRDEGWYGYLISPTYREYLPGFEGSSGGFRVYEPLGVQLVNMPLDWYYNNVSTELALENIATVLPEAINESLNYNEWFFTNLSMLGLSNLTKIIDSMIKQGGSYKLLAEYVYKHAWLVQEYDTILKDIMDKNNSSELVAGPVDPLLEDIDDTLTQMNELRRQNYSSLLYNNTPGIVTELISLAQDYNLVHIIQQLTDPLLGYTLVEASINTTVSSMVGYYTPIYSSNTLFLDDLLSGPWSKPRIVYTPSWSMLDCMQLYAPSGSIPPEVLEMMIEQRLMRIKHPFLTAAKDFTDLLVKIDGTAGRITELRNDLVEKYGTSDIRELARIGYTTGDPEVLDYIQLVMHRYKNTVLANTVAGAVSSFDPTSLGVLVEGLLTGETPEGAEALSPIYSGIIAMLDNAGITSNLESFGIYMYGSRINDPAGGASTSYIGGYFTAAATSLAMSLPSITRLGINSAQLAEYTASTTGIAVSAGEVQKLNLMNIKNAKLVKISGTLIDKYLEPATYSIAVGDTALGRQLMGDALSYMRSEGLLTESGLSANMLVHDSNTVMFASKPVGQYAKPLIIEVVDSDNALGAVATISREPGTGYNYISFGHVKEKTFTINAQGVTKKIHPADIHVFTIDKVPYIYSAKKQTIIVSQELIDAYNTNPYSLATLFQDSGLTATASYIMKTDASVEEAYKFLGLYRELRFKIKSSISNPDVANEMINLLENYMTKGDYQSILELGRNYGLVDASGQITGVSIDVMSAKNLVEHINNMGEIRAIRNANYEINKALQKYYAAKQGTPLNTILYNMIIKPETGNYLQALQSTSKLTTIAAYNMIKDAYWGLPSDINSLGLNLEVLCKGECSTHGSLPGDPLITQIIGNLIESTCNRLVVSIDPNEIYLEPEHYLTEFYNTIKITVTFENSPQATGQAHNITIIVNINGPIDLNNAIIQGYSPIHAKIKGTTINNTTIKIELKDANLPPNINPPEGEGYLVISIPLDEPASGDTISAQASIIFDCNKPVNTSIKQVIIDQEPPQVSVIDSILDNNAAKINYTCQDDASGCVKILLALLDKNLTPIKPAIPLNNTGQALIPIEEDTVYLELIPVDAAGHFGKQTIIKLESTTGPEETTTQSTTNTQATETSSKRIYWIIMIIIITVALASYLYYHNIRKESKKQEAV